MSFPKGRLLATLTVVCGLLPNVASGCDDQRILDPFPPAASEGACSSNRDCDGAERYCDEGARRCVECRSSADCDRGTCDPLNRVCFLPCSSNEDCTGSDWLCDSVRGVCVECTSASHCDASDPICRGGNCVECLNDDDCSSEQPFCETTRGNCGECLVDEHCPAGEHCRRDLWCDTPNDEPR